jgi:hypothetical protein
MEKNAKGVRGFLLYSPFSKNYFFRVYNKDKTFTDYKITAEEIEIELISKYNALIETDSGNILDFSSEVLGKK